MPESTVVRTRRDGTILIVGGALSYTVAYEVGDFQFDVPRAATELFLDRDEITSVPSIRKGATAPITFSFSAHCRDLVSASYATLLDIGVLFASGYVLANMTSTIGTASDVKTFTVTFTCEGSDFGSSDMSIVFSYADLRVSMAEGMPNTINVTGTAYMANGIPTFS